MGGLKIGTMDGRKDCITEVSMLIVPNTGLLVAVFWRRISFGFKVQLTHPLRVVGRSSRWAFYLFGYFIGSGNSVYPEFPGRLHYFLRNDERKIVPSLHGQRARATMPYLNG